MRGALPAPAHRIASNAPFKQQVGCPATEQLRSGDPREQIVDQINLLERSIFTETCNCVWQVIQKVRHDCPRLDEKTAQLIDAGPKGR